MNDLTHKDPVFFFAKLPFHVAQERDASRLEPAGTQRKFQTGAIRIMYSGLVILEGDLEEYVLDNSRQTDSRRFYDPYKKHFYVPIIPRGSCIPYFLIIDACEISGDISSLMDTLRTIYPKVDENAYWVNAQDHNGCTILHRMARDCTAPEFLEFVKTIPDKGLRVDTKNHCLETAIDILCRDKRAFYSPASVHHDEDKRVSEENKRCYHEALLLLMNKTESGIVIFKASNVMTIILAFCSTHDKSLELIQRVLCEGKFVAKDTMELIDIFTTLLFQKPKLLRYLVICFKSHFQMPEFVWSLMSQKNCYRTLMPHLVLLLDNIMRSSYIFNHILHNEVEVGYYVGIYFSHVWPKAVASVTKPEWFRVY